MIQWAVGCYCTSKLYGSSSLVENNLIHWNHFILLCLPVQMKSLWKLCWLEENINSKNRKKFNFPKHKLFKQAEVLISHLLLISVNSSVILTKAVDINCYPQIAERSPWTPSLGVTKSCVLLVCTKTKYFFISLQINCVESEHLKKILKNLTDLNLWDDDQEWYLSTE